MKKTALTFALLACAGMPPAQARETGFLDRSITFEGQTYAYQVCVPRDYDPDRQWPVILFLHGAGERGSNGTSPTQEGLGTALRLWPERWPAICVFPQAPEETVWQGPQARLAMATLAAAEKEFSTDPRRVYLTGISMGGNGAWYLGFHHPELFAALVPICGFLEVDSRSYPLFTPPGIDDPYAEVASHIKDLPIWVVHGDADSVVPVEQSRRMVAALKKAGAEVRYVELPGVDHGSWHPGYADEELPRWLFSKGR